MTSERISKITAAARQDGNDRGYNEFGIRGRSKPNREQLRQRFNYFIQQFNWLTSDDIEEFWGVWMDAWWQGFYALQSDMGR